MTDQLIRPVPFIYYPHPRFSSRNPLWKFFYCSEHRKEISIERQTKRNNKFLIANVLRLPFSYRYGLNISKKTKQSRFLKARHEVLVIQCNECMSWHDPNSRTSWYISIRMLNHLYTSRKNEKNDKGKRIKKNRASRYLRHSGTRSNSLLTARRHHSKGLGFS